MIVLFNGRDLNSEKYCVYRNMSRDISEEYITSLLPYAIYNGCVFVYKPYWKKCLSLPFLSILTPPKLLGVFMALPLSIFIMSK